MSWYEPAPNPPMKLDYPLTERVVARYEREWRAAQAKSEAASRRRAGLGPGCSRAAITTANARWMSAAEHRDRLLERFERAREEFAAQPLRTP